MIQRHLFQEADAMLQKYPMIAITGARQSGKTTFAQQLRPDFRYVSLEDPDTRLFAHQDPRAFLETYQHGVIIDEIQYAPELFSYLQTYTDQRKRNGEYILTGSQNFRMMEGISQSLAGRVALFTLLPFSYNELSGSTFQPPNWERYLFKGSYPRLYMQDIPPRRYYDDYLQTYLERDVRQLVNVQNLLLFQRFIQLLAGRIGQLLNQSGLATEVGVDNKTISAWLSVLETSYLVYRLPPYYNNFSKRIIKAPKVYFYDTGLASYLLGIRQESDLDVHFARGGLFENLVINETLKQFYHRGERPQVYFWNDSQHHEIDLLMDVGLERHAYEMKAGKTVHSSFFDGLRHFQKVAPDTKLHLVYGGDLPQQRTDIIVHSFLSRFG